jgi:hypothetical protein
MLLVDHLADEIDAIMNRITFLRRSVDGLILFRLFCLF